MSNYSRCFKHLSVGSRLTYWFQLLLVSGNKLPTRACNVSKVTGHTANSISRPRRRSRFCYVAVSFECMIVIVVFRSLRSNFKGASKTCSGISQAVTASAGVRLFTECDLTVPCRWKRTPNVSPASNSNHRWISSACILALCVFGLQGRSYITNLAIRARCAEWLILTRMRLTRNPSCIKCSRVKLAVLKIKE